MRDHLPEKMDETRTNELYLLSKEFPSLADEELNLFFLFLSSLGYGVTALNSKCEHEFPHYLPLLSIRLEEGQGTHCH
jgi:hypothetical protein